VNGIKKVHASALSKIRMIIMV